MPPKARRRPRPKSAKPQSSRASARTQVSSATQEPNLLEKLPLELRIMIWEATLQDAQAHRATTRANGGVEGQRGVQFVPLIIPAAVRVALQVHRESRWIAKARLKRFSIYPRSTPTDLLDASTPYGYFNPNVDFIHFSGPFAINFLSISEPFQNISIHWYYSSPLFGTAQTISALAKRDSPPHICLVLAEMILPLSGHNCGRATIPLGTPELNVSPRDERNYKLLVGGWIKEVESNLEATHRPSITVGHIPFACDCEGFMEEKMTFIKERNKREAKEDRDRWMRKQRLEKIRARRERSQALLEG